MTVDTSWWQRAPRLLDWADLDPARHPFDRVSAPAVVRSLAPPVPPRPADRGVAWQWYREMTDALTGRYGVWAYRWSAISTTSAEEPAWPGLEESISTSDETLARVVASLTAWRAWLEETAERFERFLPAVQADPDDSAAWEAAVAHLVRTAGVWHEYGGGQGYWIVIWFLTAAGQPVDRSETAMREALNPNRQSVYDPLTPAEVVDVAEAVAQAIVGHRELPGPVPRPQVRAEDWPDTWPHDWPSWRATNRPRP